MRKSILSVLALLLIPTLASAHCDTMDGPVVTAAKAALESGNASGVLIWVRKQDEAEVLGAFQRALSVRKTSGEARELADQFFFETLVRVHRTGEGAPYTGLKPAGQDHGPAIPAADEALTSGNLRPLAKLLVERMHQTLHHKFEDAASKRSFDPANVEAGREYVESYVKYMHYVEHVFEAVGGGADDGHGGGGDGHGLR